MSITVTNKEAIEVVAKQAKERGAQPGETAGLLIVYAGKRLAALAKYERRQDKAIKGLGKVGKVLRSSKTSAAKRRDTVAVQRSGKAGLVVGAEPIEHPRLAGLLKKKALPGEAKAAKKVTEELGKISKILRSQEAERKVAGKSSTLPTLVFEDVKKPKKTPKTSFAKKFKKEKGDQ